MPIRFHVNQSILPQPSHSNSGSLLLAVVASAKKAAKSLTCSSLLSLHTGTFRPDGEPASMKQRRALLLSITLVLTLCATCGWWLHKERQQYADSRQLIDALERGDATTALTLVNEGADPNTRQTPPPTPTFHLLLAQLLHHSLPPTDHSPTAFLIASGIAWNLGGYSAQELPVTLDENIPLLQAMLASGADVESRDSNKRTSLHYAVWMGRWPTVQLLLQHGANVNVQDTDGITPLMWAAANDNVHVAQLLLSHGANPNIQDASGSTALYYAVSSPNPEVLVLELMVYHANLTLHNNDGDTPLRRAQQRNRPDLVRLLKRGTK